jgi:hypothetical protein
MFSLCRLVLIILLLPTLSARAAPADDPSLALIPANAAAVMQVNGIERVQERL